MNSWQIAFCSLRHYWPTDLVVALGVAAATAVLTGALIVGDSMQESLRALTLDRLGKIDEMLLSDGFFRAELANELAQTDQFKSDYSAAVPAILFPNGTVEFQPGSDASERKIARVSNVNVIGITPEFWSLDKSLHDVSLSGRQVVINRALADQVLGSAGWIQLNPATICIG